METIEREDMGTTTTKLKENWMISVLLSTLLLAVALVGWMGREGIHRIEIDIANLKTDVTATRLDIRKIKDNKVGADLVDSVAIWRIMQLTEGYEEMRKRVTALEEKLR